MKKTSYRQRQFLLGWLFFVGCYFTVDWIILIVPNVSYAVPGIRELVARYHTGVVVTFAFLASSRRAAAAHPLSNACYLDWVRMTPWQPGMPLPRGRVTLGIIDFLTVVVFTLAAHWNMPHGAEWTLSAFALAYVLGGFPILVKARMDTELVTLSFIAPVFIWVAPSAMSMLIVSVAMAAISIAGVQRSFSTYPWDDKKPAPITERWPLLQLRDAKPMVSLMEGVAVASLIGLWGSAITHHIHTTVPDAAPAIAMFVVGVGFLRFVIYLSKGRVPVSLLYRVFHGPALIPKFDVIFITPILIGLVGASTWGTTALLRFPVEAVVGLTAFATVLVALVAGPQLKTWQLTAFINVNIPRYRPPFATKARTAATS